MRVLSFEKGNKQSGQVLYVSVVQEKVINKDIIIAAFSEVKLFLNLIPFRLGGEVVSSPRESPVLFQVSRSLV